jgi:hypothetical protein
MVQVLNQYLAPVHLILCFSRNNFETLLWTNYTLLDALRYSLAFLHFFSQKCDFLRLGLTQKNPSKLFHKTQLFSPLSEKEQVGPTIFLFFKNKQKTDKQ